MFGRDRGRFEDTRKRLNESPLGAAALAGTSFPIDRDATAHSLGFARPMRNSMDAISARDFALEYLAACSIAAVHLSRLAGELVQWSTPMFGFVKLSDAFTTGSSIMPQKRNPDVFELLRGRSAIAQAALAEVLAITQKLPSGYHRDLQLIKPPLFRAIDSCRQSLDILPAALSGVRFEPGNIRLDPGIHAAAAANALVAKENIPFREAYQRVAAALKEPK
jgi:argininosuccinate lyase